MSFGRPSNRRVDFAINNFCSSVVRAFRFKFLTWGQNGGQGSSSHERMIWPCVYNMGGTRKKDEACNYLKISFMSWCKIIFALLAVASTDLLASQHAAVVFTLFHQTFMHTLSWLVSQIMVELTFAYSLHC